MHGSIISYAPGTLDVRFGSGGEGEDSGAASLQILSPVRCGVEVWESRRENVSGREFEMVPGPYRRLAVLRIVG